ncbi:MAG: hypothetical protein K5978_04155 [Campylobacter sp.]|nr:hypothetical protein [Campylobacter sp.]
MNSCEQKSNLIHSVKLEISSFQSQIHKFNTPITTTKKFKNKDGVKA